eukprot:TRINITY_DN15540_c0_g3_i1.p1 TRINITY_DN15540_c0_g3~~TRINITY_DN15540_c0_g3_i1.p1  ORF type:complete len:411 (+),score=66.68 TRINITY_DN15540_c0_g3_i1:174-1406(+)
MILTWSPHIGKVALLGVVAFVHHFTDGPAKVHAPPEVAPATVTPHEEPSHTNIAVSALVFGTLSALSLPLGAVCGVMCHPVNEKIVARLVAFGAGALLFAVTIELYGGVLHEIEATGEAAAFFPGEGLSVSLYKQYCRAFVSLAACLVGAYGYLRLNRKLKDWAEDKPCSYDPMTSDDEPEESEAHQNLRVELWSAQVSMKRQESFPISGHPTPIPPSRIPELGGSAQTTPLFPHRAPRSQTLEIIQKDDGKKWAAAVAILVGVCIDGFCEGILIGFMAAHRNLSVDFVFSVFLANFPEAFSIASMLTELQQHDLLIMAGSSALMIITGLTSGLTAFFLQSGVDLEGLNAQLVTGGVEGVAAGAMLMMIMSVMIPEAFEVQGDVSSMYIVFGFLGSIGLRICTGFVHHFG